MGVDHPKIFIVGCGPGGPEYVTPAANGAVACAKIVMGAKRLRCLFPESTSRQVPLPAEVEPALRAIAEHSQAGPVAVLVSGDPGLFSLAKAMVSRFGRGNCEVVPAVSSLQVAFARLALDWSDLRMLSAHGRWPQVSAQELCRLEKIAVFAGTPQATSWIGRLAEELAASHTLFLCENLTLPEEDVREVRSDELRSVEFSPLSLVIFVRCSALAEEQQASDSTGDVI